MICMSSTQKTAVWPDAKTFHNNAVRVTGGAGSIFCGVGLLAHCAMPNKSRDVTRVGLLGQYLPKYIKPMEDQRYGVHQSVVDAASPQLQSLLAANYPYPLLFDHAPAGNSEGSKSEFEWK
eukprot:GFYU01022577.1.p1 GENE.GFYU01022577.1~~GFYU01022577.1.p1  ORF type:complete len:121 (+),score=23.12 GFYU01022577.1:2-364(+)